MRTRFFAKTSKNFTDKRPKIYKAISGEWTAIEKNAEKDKDGNPVKFKDGRAPKLNSVISHQILSALMITKRSSQFPRSLFGQKPPDGSENAVLCGRVKGNLVPDEQEGGFVPEFFVP